MDIDRLAVLLVSPELLLEMCKHGTGAYEIAENPIPEDAELFNVISGFEQNTIGLVLSSPSFAIIDSRKPQILLPTLPKVVFRKVVPEELPLEESEREAEGD